MVYFYNPLVWLANARVRRVREQAVDEMVLVALRGGSESYSDVLIDIGEMAFWRPNFSLRLIGVVESKKALAARIKHIVSRPIPKTAKLGIVGSIAVVLIGAVLLPMARAEKADLDLGSGWRENSESTVAADMLDAITQPTPHPAPALWIYEANSELARLARAVAGEGLKGVSSKSVSSAGSLLASYFRRFKYAVTVDDWRAELASQGEIDEKKDTRIRKYEEVRDVLAACVSGEPGIEELRRLASELEELSGELQDAAADDKLYLVPAIYEELDRKWKDFRATLRLGSIDALGLVAFWKFDEHAGSTAYDMAGNNDGTIHGAQSFNGGLRFDGRDDYMSIPDFHLAKFSFSVWLQPLDLSDNRRVFLLDDGDCFFAIQLNNRGGVGFEASTAGGETDWDVGVKEYDWRLGEDMWTHIVVTYDGRTVNIYKDGELTESGMGEFIKSVRGTAYIGGTDKYRGQFWHGMLDEVAIFNRPLSAAEVNRLYMAMPRVNTKVAKTLGGWSEPVRLAPAINTEYDENYPYLSADGESLYFNSNRPGGYGGADIYVARKIDGVWQRPENLGPVINSARNEAGAMLSYDGKYLFFWSDRMAGPSTMLFVSKIVEGRFQTPEPLPYFINSALHTDEPFLSADGEMLYFQTFGRQGNIKIRDLWCSKFSDGEFETPVNLGPVVNRFGRQKSPSLTADGRYLYYVYEMADKRTGIVVAERRRRNFMNPVEIKFPSLAELRAVQPVVDASKIRFRRTGPVKDETDDTRDVIGQQDRDRPVVAAEIEGPAGESDPGYPRGYIDSAKISWSGKELYFSMKDGNYDIWYAGQAPAEAIGKLGSGLVGHWKFDEGSGNTAYDSAGNNNGTIHGAKWTKSKVGGALSFDGKDNYVMIPDSDVFDFGKGNFSISTWFKTVSMSDQFIIGFRNGTKCIEMYVNSASHVGSYIDTGSETIRLPFINTKYNDGKWHHAAITLDNGVGNGYRLFLDGIMVGALTCSADFSDWSHIAIGGNPKGTWNKHFFNGQIDEIAIYNQALS
ncbi:MAG: LamG-like jellyroll fold domain-containing protein, partial [Planctomycetota bacterium]